MSTSTKYKILEAIRIRYKNSAGKIKTQLLNEFRSLYGYNRKYAIRLLNSSAFVKSVENLSKRGRKKVYDDPIILVVLRDIWVATNLPWLSRKVCLSYFHLLLNIGFG
ncbi:hypothetical protein J7K93_01390 [bacterium]|nr:hypothetical protein [bacterium]